MQTTITELRSEIEVLTGNLNGQIESLRAEKNTLEKSLVLEKALKAPTAPGEPDAVMVSTFVTVRCLVNSLSAGCSP